MNRYCLYRSAWTETGKPCLILSVPVGSFTLRHRFVKMNICFSFPFRRPENIKNPVPAYRNAGTGVNSCGATLLDAYASSLRILTYAGFCFRRTILRLTYSKTFAFFPLALGSPFSVISSAAFPPPAALCVKMSNAYSLFLIGCDLSL